MDKDAFYNEIDIEKYSADIKSCDQVFVYGTLKTGGEIRGMNTMGLNVVPKGKAKTSYPDYEMLDLGAFPGLLKGDSYIFGEVWQLDEQALFTLDGIEGFDRDEEDVDWRLPVFGNAYQHSFYSRTIIETSQGKAWVYFLGEKEYGKYRGLESDNIEKQENTLTWHN
jgi:gamma-glutamylcyclotransferase (GGCT)/AIG2-like uncharacterized protein YtfP